MADQMARVNYSILHCDIEMFQSDMEIAIDRYEIGHEQKWN